jgi:hypothetical protein
MIALVLMLAMTTERFEDVAFRLAHRPVDAACVEMQSWVDEHQGRDDAARGLLWIARKRLDAHDRPSARAALERATAGRGRFGAEAVRLLAAMDIEDGRLDDAKTQAETLASSSEPMLAEEGKELLDEIARKEVRRTWLELSIAFLAVDVIVRGARTKRKLWPPPFEALAAGPVLAMLLVVGILRGMTEVPLIAILASSGLALAWFRGAHRRAFPLRLPLRLLDAALALVEAASLTYAVLDGGNALDNLILTLTAGPA